jgi:DNA adenine methylase
MAHQLPLFETNPDSNSRIVAPFKTQLLKWVGNKQRFAHEIVGYFARQYGTYYEPFIGSGAVLGTLAPNTGVASDALEPLIEIWQTLKGDPEKLKRWYSERWHICIEGDKVEGYEKIKASFNEKPNGADLLFLSRSCYGGVVRFRKDGYMSTPCGVHNPISPESFDKRVDIWHQRVKNTLFIHSDFETMMYQAKEGDLIYCDPPYTDTQAILYGAQQFSLDRLFRAIADCKLRGVYVALSIDGTKKTGKKKLKIDIPTGLFKREATVNCGRSMLRRFQMEGQTLENEEVTDRLLLTY